MENKYLDLLLVIYSTIAMIISPVAIWTLLEDFFGITNKSVIAIICLISFFISVGLILDLYVIQPMKWKKEEQEK